jgi:hypothetical protein
MTALKIWKIPRCYDSGETSVSGQLLAALIPDGTQTIGGWPMKRQGTNWVMDRNDHVLPRYQHWQHVL